MAAAALRRKRPMNIRVVIDEKTFRQADRLLATLPREVQAKVLPGALRGAAKPAVRLMKQLAPDSRKSGSRRRWSAKLRNARVGVKQHKKTIGVSTVRKYGQLTAIYAGPIHPAGNLINVIGHPHLQVLWGNRMPNVLPANEYVIQAGKQTRGATQIAFVSAMKKGVHREAMKLRP